ncbi:MULTISPECIES: hypothetical protein [Flavobacteriaceae]|uniref:hypothetical protein n=1 Tax=Flavobacteriaceae TaxID=49546 RepID=UPI001492269D|nr:MULTISPECIES: hypothetical protein [Allomuricauda]MDC6366634.1 hypothetical protein [Muricauda sp. AC10]
MKIILLLITVCFASMAVTSCTNDEGENDLDFITPEEEQQILGETEKMERT